MMMMNVALNEMMHRIYPLAFVGIRQPFQCRLHGVNPLFCNSKAYLGTCEEIYFAIFVISSC